MYIRLLILNIILATGAQTQSCSQPLENAPTSVSDTAALKELTAAQEAPTCTSLLDRAPRGLACLHCLHPAAREQSDILVEILSRSCLKQVAINYLVDGSFSENGVQEETYLRDRQLILKHIEHLTIEGREPLLHLYLLNGPAQRRYDSNPGRGLFTEIAPAEFRRRILDDENIRTSFGNHVRALLPLLSSANAMGARISIVPMLEDNLDAESFVEIGRLVETAIGDTVSYSIGRSACPSCANGSDSTLPKRYFREIHSLKHSSGVTGGLVTNDGEDDLSSEQISEALKVANMNGNTFIIWSATRQGLRPSGNGGYMRQDPNEREYQIPSLAEIEDLLSLLRE